MENLEDKTTNNVIKKSTNKAEVEEEGPGNQFEVFLQNEIVTERLKLLNYEIEFTKLGDSLKTVTRFILNIFLINV
jgi:hypothetical protein